MKIRKFAVLGLLLGLGVNAAADDASNIPGQAVRMVVIANDEGIHFAHGCTFYELRGLIADVADNVSKSTNTKGKALYELRLLGVAGQSTIHIGDHWMRTPDGAAPIPATAFIRIRELIENRKGQGVKKRRIEASIKRALTIVQSPGFVEDNRCGKGDDKLPDQ